MKSQDDSNLAELIAPLNYVFWSFVSIFLFCGTVFDLLFSYILIHLSQFVLFVPLSEFGGMVTKQFDAFDEQLCQSNWYLYPNGMQRLLLIFILDAQQPVLIRGYGTIVCTREFFEKASSFVFGCIRFEYLTTLNKFYHLLSILADNQWSIFIFYGSSTNQ